VDKVASAELVEVFAAMADRPWAECRHGKPINQNWLAEAPPERVLDALRENKPQIVAILRASIRPVQRRCVACRCRRRCPIWLLGCSNKAGIPMLIGHAWAALPNTFGRAPSDLFDVTPDGPGEFE